MIKFGSARISENGTVYGQRGDQNSREVMEQEAYWHKNGWGKAIRAKDPNVANAIAWVMKVACISDIPGYSQDPLERYLIFLTNIRQGVPTNCDCSTLVPYCVTQAGITNFELDGIWTGNLRQRLLSTGAFDEVAFSSLDELCTGDILIDKPATSHTVVVTEGNPRSWNPAFDVPEPTLQYGSQGAEVRKLQAFFNEYGSGCKVDGDFGSDTRQLVIDFQRIFGLKPDGIYGKQTHDLLVFFLWSKDVQTI